MRWSLITLQVLVAVGSVVNVAAFRLQALLAPRSTELDYLALAAVIAIAALSACAVLVWRGAPAARAMRIIVSVVLVALTVLAGFTPRVVEARRQSAREATRLYEQQRRDQAFARELREWTDDIDSRAATLRPLAPDQAFAFIGFVSQAGRRTDGPDKPSEQALALLRKALQAGIIDVNAPVQGRRRNDLGPRPLFLQFYKEHVEPLRRITALPVQDWTIMQLLAANGADLTLPEASTLVVDLGKTAVPGAEGFVGLR